MVSVADDEKVLWRAEFNPKVKTYWLLSGIFVLAVTVVGIPLLVLWIPLGLLVTERYLRRMECVLTSKALHMGKGWLVRQEKTIPLDKITDMGLVQGPIMRWLDLEALSVETAGQSSAGALLKLIGIVDTRKFRAAVLKQRDAVVDELSSDDGSPGRPPPPSGDETVTLLTDIRDAVVRLEQRLRDS